MVILLALMIKMEGNVIWKWADSHIKMVWGYAKLAPIVDRIIDSSSIFKWINRNILVTGILSKQIEVKSYSRSKSIIIEWERNCERFFVLIDGSVDIISGGQVISQLSWIQTFWEMWFLDPEAKRTATVRTRQDVVVLIFERLFINQLSAEMRATIYQNLCIELTRKISRMNDRFAEVADQFSQLSQVSRKIAWDLTWTMHEGFLSGEEGISLMVN